MQELAVVHVDAHMVVAAGAEEHQIAHLKDVLDKHEDFVIKPANGSGGNGIIVIAGKTPGGYFRKANDALVSITELEHHVSNILSGMYSLGGDTDADSEQLMIAWCQDVADAAGGLLGLRSARHDAEHAALKTIAAAVDVRNAKHWRAFLEQTSGA